MPVPELLDSVTPPISLTFHSILGPTKSLRNWKLYSINGGCFPERFTRLICYYFLNKFKWTVKEQWFQNLSISFNCFNVVARNTTCTIFTDIWWCEIMLFTKYILLYNLLTGWLYKYYNIKLHKAGLLCCGLW